MTLQARLKRLQVIIKILRHPTDEAGLANIEVANKQNVQASSPALIHGYIESKSVSNSSFSSCFSCFSCFSFLPSFLPSENAARQR
tara:strand:- start:76 stop:333 length:258 start_codon:yes stop_codon:yes gene_type:complete